MKTTGPIRRGKTKAVEGSKVQNAKNFNFAYA